MKWRIEDDQSRRGVMIKRPAEELFAFVSNFENKPQGQAGVQEATITSGESVGPGATYLQVAEFLDRRIGSTSGLFGKDFHQSG